MEQIVLFDYMGLDTETRIIVQQRTSEIKTLVKRSAQDIIEIGQKLIEVKARLGHGNFGPWLDSEFGWTPMTAARFMQVGDKFKNNNLLDLNFGASALYLLAAPSAPEPARIEAIERAEAGEVITHKTAKEIVTEYQRKEFQDAQDERRFAKELFGPEPVLVHGPIGNYTQEGSLKRCEKCHQLWAADLNYCPYCNISPDARALHLQNERSTHVSHNSGNNEWYTPEPFIIAARAVMGGIDLDPASSVEANRIVGASTIHTKEDDGLLQPWAGRVWMNPPYAAPLISQFCDRLSVEFLGGAVAEAIVLVNNATETGWFAALIDSASAVVFPQSRVKFWQPDGTMGAPLQGQAIIYLGGKPKTFLAEFKTFGWGAQL